MDGRNGRSDGQTDEWIDAWLDGGMDGVVFAALKLRILFLRFFLLLSIVCSFFLFICLNKLMKFVLYYFRLAVFILDFFLFFFYFKVQLNVSI